MPRADFYLIAKPRFRAEPLRLVCELARKAHDAGLWTLVMARDAAPVGGFERILEVVPADPAARGPLRERWKHYQSLGFELKKYDM